jgi:hypothetical protein
MEVAVVYSRFAQEQVARAGDDVARLLGLAEVVIEYHFSMVSLCHLKRGSGVT